MRPIHLSSPRGFNTASIPSPSFFKKNFFFYVLPLPPSAAFTIGLGNDFPVDRARVGCLCSASDLIRHAIIRPGLLVVKGGGRRRRRSFSRKGNCCHLEALDPPQVLSALSLRQICFKTFLFLWNLSLQFLPYRSAHIATEGKRIVLIGEGAKRAWLGNGA